MIFGFVFRFLRLGWGHHASFGGHVGSFEGPFFVLGGVYASVAPLPKSFKTPWKNEVFDESRFPASWTFGVLKNCFFVHVGVISGHLGACFGLTWCHFGP